MREIKFPDGLKNRRQPGEKDQAVEGQGMSCAG